MTRGTDMARTAVASSGFTLRVMARNPSIREALSDLRGRLERHDLTLEELNTVEVVLAEVMNNVAEHAYAWRQDGEMLVHLRVATDGLHCSVTDEGRAMPDDALPFGGDLDPGMPIDDLPEGGFGWLIIRRLAHDVRYLRQSGVNELSFRLAVGTPVGAAAF